jgi:hypothetical protein
VSVTLSLLIILLVAGAFWYMRHTIIEIESGQTDDDRVHGETLLGKWLERYYS